MSGKIITLPRADSSAVIEQMRRWAEKLSAEFDPATLPDGDAGLIEAERRLREIEVREDDIERQFKITYDIDQAIRPTLDELKNRLDEYVEDQAPRTLTGAAVKLRYLIRLSECGFECIPALRQVVKFIERGGAVMKGSVMIPGPIAELVDEVEALCKIHVRKDAESEEWGDTCKRLDRLDKLVKRVRRAQAKGSAQP